MKSLLTNRKIYVYVHTFIEKLFGEKHVEIAEYLESLNIKEFHADQIGEKRNLKKMI